ncbi:MAG TPA: methyltransferase domain-containing protein [Gaiellaceae bacterium]|nr:methyltransferase domain-containing protein [Gaiellaceae bacterium]
MSGRVGAIHEAARGFERAPRPYEIGRPDYPEEAIERLVAELGMEPGSRVLDLAAGTGKLTRRLVPTGAEIVAVEPTEGMRSALSSSLPEVEALAGTAEAIPVPDGSVDAVVVGQAFHWFDGDAALAEIHRVLSPGGRLGLIWNLKDESVDWIERLGDIINSYRGDAPRVASGAWKAAFDRTKLFTPLERARFSFVHEADFAAVVARVTSVSFVAALPAPEFERVVEQVRTLLATHPQTRGRTTFELPYRTGVYWCSSR